MSREESYTILRALVNGVHPETGADLSADDLTQQPDVLQALYLGMMALRTEEKPESKVKEKPVPQIQASRPWSEQDLETLRQMKEEGDSLEYMAWMFRRRKREIVKLMASDTGEVRENRGKRWSDEEEQLLRRRYEQKVPLEDIARELRRGEYGVYFRMERLGLTGDECGYPPDILWTEKSLRQLVELARQGMTPEEIALKIGMPVDSVRGRMFYMGLSRRSPVRIREEKE